MENREESPAGEQLPTDVERGLLHVWRSAGCSEQLSPERLLLPWPVVQVALGEHHGLLLAQGGQVFSFGELLWRDMSIPVSAPVLEGSLLGKMVIRVAAGGFHCGALTEQGSVYMWGENTAGQCGQTDRGTIMNITVSEPSPVSVVDTEVIPPAMVRVLDLACGREHSLALSAQNELWAWGSGCQLGLVTNTFPVWKPQKVEHLAGRHVIQVACGAYHSLAVVRSLPHQDYNTQNPPKKRERDQSPHCPVPDREELLTAEDAHYCPLGVELTEVMRSETPSRRQAPQQNLHPGEMSSGSSPGSGTSSCWLSENSKSNTKQRNLLVSTRLEPEGNTDSESQVDGSPKAQQMSDWRINKNSAFHDELQNLLEKLSGPLLELQHTSRTGETDSLSSQTSDDSSTDLNSSYKDESSYKRQTNSNSGPSGPYSSSPVCLEEVRLCLEREKQALQGQKSSSLTNIHQKGRIAASRRRSLPGTPTHGRNGRV